MKDLSWGKGLIVVLLVLVMAVSFAPSSSAQERELLLFKEIPIVFTASKKEQPITEAPSAMSVITAEDIKQSGITNLADIFRFVAGMDTGAASGVNTQVSARGFNTGQCNKMLVLVDGCTFYNPLHSGAIWNQIPIFLEDVERIEVIRGSGASLWGANAFNGVINIITKDVKDTQGTLISSTIGNHDTFIGNLIYGEKTQNLGYRVSLGYSQDSGFDGTDGRELYDWKRFPKFNFQSKYDINSDSSFQFGAGGIDGKEGRYLSGTVEYLGAVAQPTTDCLSDYQWAKYKKQISDTSNLAIQLFRTELNMHVEGMSDPIDSSVYDLDVQHSFALAENQAIVWGANIRKNLADAKNFESSDIDEVEHGLFIQDEVKLRDNLTLVAGSKYEHTPKVGAKFSPQVSLLYSPLKNHTFRASVNRAYRNPSFLEQFTNINVPSLTYLGWPFTGSFQGDEALKPEKVTSYELGYRTQLTDKTRFNLELYYSKIKDLIGYNSSYALGLPGTIRIWSANQNDARVYGTEVGIEQYFVSWCKGFLNYTYQNLRDTTNELRIKFSPRDKVNTGINFGFKNGVSVNCLLSYVSKITTTPIIPLLASGGDIGDYTRLDIRLAKTFKDKDLEIAVTGQNLAGEHRELDRVNEVNRMFYFTVSKKF